MVHFAGSHILKNVSRRFLNFQIGYSEEFLEIFHNWIEAFLELFLNSHNAMAILKKLEIFSISTLDSKNNIERKDCKNIMEL